MDNLDNNQIQTFVIDLAEVMLANGAEIYRVEESMAYVTAKLTGDKGENFVTPTSIISTLGPALSNQTMMRRIRYRSVNFEKVSLANNISREISAGILDLDQARQALTAIKATPTQPTWLSVVVGGVAAGSFSLMFGGQVGDHVASMLVGFSIQIVLAYLDYIRLSMFVRMIIGGGVTTLGTLTLLSMGLGYSQDIILTSAIMLLVPGVALTNAFRDILASDYLSGVSRLSEALFIAVCIAFGVVGVLWGWALWL